MVECRQEQNKVDCPCTYPGCPRKGLCCECLKHHLASKELPGCCFSQEGEATFDRSFERVIKENS